MRRLLSHLPPYVLAGPGIALLLVFFCAPAIYLLQTSLQAGTLESGYRFDWAWQNFADGLERYGPHLLRSVVYGASATALGLAVAYPLVYWIVTRGGRFKALLLLCVVAPFFVTYLIRTLAWQTILQDDGAVVAVLRALGLVADGGSVLATPFAVVTGITYNYFPLMALPLYASVERLDLRLREAAGDLYATGAQTFLRVTLPLSLPGVLAGSLLMFIPACGDYVNAALLGSPDQAMIGNVIHSKFLIVADYPAAAALSCILMALIVVGALAWVRAFGRRMLTA
jgi:spermidine/putrescine transport system permease protein